MKKKMKRDEGSSGVGGCFDDIAFHSQKIPAGRLLVLMRHDYQADYRFNT
jgi:hypothetical protein